MRTAPLRFLASVNESVLPEATSPDFTFKYVDISQVDGTGEVSIPDDPTKFGTAPSRARRLAEPGSTVVSTVRTYLRAIAAVPTVDEQLVFSTGFAVLRPLQGDPRYFSYACRSDAFVNEIVARSVGVSYPAISPSELMGIRLPSPDITQQRRIADFLDDRVARIDQIISARQQQAVLAESAYLDSLRRFTDGLGRADGWSRPRVAHIFRTGSGSTPPSDHPEYYDGAVPWVNTGDVRDSRIAVTARTVTELAPAEFSTLVRYPTGSLVIAMYGQGATKGRVGLLSLEACVNQACCVLQHGEPLLLQWAFHWFRAHKADIVELANGAGQPNLSQDIVRNLRPTLPPSDALPSLLREIDQRDAASIGAQSALRAQIDLLAEYKQSLITAAVTGELDVTTAGSGIPNPH